MSETSESSPIDLIRWTFTADPSRRAEVETYLTDLGLDVQVRDGCRFCATWDEPDDDVDEVIEELWAINGAPFEVTHEEFRRLDHVIFHQEDDGEADRAVA